MIERKMPKILQRVGDMLKPIAMKEFEKAQLIAKNLPTGSYAAGCPAESHYGNGDWDCRRCEITK